MLLYCVAAQGELENATKSLLTNDCGQFYTNGTMLKENINSFWSCFMVAFSMINKPKDAGWLYAGRAIHG